MKYKQIWKTAAACLMAAVMLPGCSDEEGGGTTNPEDKYRTLVISINSRSNAEPVGTRAEKDPITDQENDEPYERHIDKWWLLVTKPAEGEGNYTIDRVITSDNYNTLEDITVSGPTGLDSEMQIGLEVEIGETYEFFAMANLNHLANWDTETGLESTVEGWENGSKFSPAALNAEMKAMTAYTETDKTYIPMTSYGYSQKIEEGTTELKSGPIELIRLLGKVTLEVKNLTDGDVTFDGLSMGKFRSGGNIFLFPYDVNGNTQNLLATDMDDTYNPSFPNNNETGTFSDTDFVDENTSAEDKTIAPYNNTDSNIKYYTAYVNETRDNSEAGGEVKDLTITTDMEGRNPNPVESGFSFVRRNDWLKIPIQITDVDATITFEGIDMPIGAQPLVYEMHSGAIVPIIDFDAGDQTGVITISFAVTNVSSITTPQIRYEGTADAGTAFTSAVVTNNNDELLIMPGDAGVSEVVPNNHELTIDPATNSFTITLQELKNTATASITLTLVITDANDSSREMIIPYTINISNEESTTN